MARGDLYMKKGYAGKRLIDVALSGLGLLALSPVIIATAIAIRWKLGAPVLFRQVRPGLYGRPFLLYKFRSMREAVDAEGRPLSDAERLTPLGKVIRKLSLDELPQLWNVFKGDMSLVGPRPLLTEYLPLYSREQARRHEVRPGITGWAQVNGRNAVAWPERFKLDVWYVDHVSLALDVKIILKTVGKVVARKGVDQENGVTMDKFTGNEGI